MTGLQSLLFNSIDAEVKLIFLPKQVQHHLYASFYDDRRQNWSILFENKHDAVEFVTQVSSFFVLFYSYLTE